MMLYDKNAQVKEVVDELRPQLLRGLGDPSESIRHTVVEFWYGKNRLPNDTFLRLGEIVRYSRRLNLMSFFHYRCQSSMLIIDSIRLL